MRDELGSTPAPFSAEDLMLKAGRMRVDGVDCDIRVVDGAAEQVLSALVEELEADLVVIGRKRGSGAGPERLFAKLGCAVLLARCGNDARDLDSALKQQA